MTKFMVSVLKMVRDKRRRVSVECGKIRDLSSGTRFGRTNKMKNKWAFGNT